MYLYLHQNGIVTAESIGELLRTLNRKFKGSPLNGIILYQSTTHNVKRIL